MKKQFKVITSIFLFGAFIFMGFSSEDESKQPKEEKVEVKTEEIPEKINIGSTYSFDTFHQIKFKTSTRYYISQKYGCGGEGNWSQSGDKIVLGPNDSNCESTRKIKGEYSINEILN